MAIFPQAVLASIMDTMFWEVKEVRMSSQTMVRTYRSSSDYAKDSAKLLSDGWTVLTVVTQQPRSGCGRILLIGIFAAVFKPKPEIVVTYQKNG